MVEVSCGNSRHEAEAARLAQVLNRLGLDGKLLIGYPVLSEDSTEQGVDAVLNSPTWGVVIFLFRSDLQMSAREILDEQDRAVYLMQAFLYRTPSLRDRRELAAGAVYET